LAPIVDEEDVKRPKHIAKYMEEEPPRKKSMGNCHHATIMEGEYPLPPRIEGADSAEEK
jgi:hypothetical protein